MNQLPTISLVLLIAFSPCYVAQAQSQEAYVSREVSVFNDLTNPVVQKDAVSREVSVYNNLSPAVQYSDAVSREVSVFNDLINPVVPKDAVSREVSVSNAFGCGCDLFGCSCPDCSLHHSLSGNLNDDGLVTLADIPPFVNVLTGITTNPQQRQAADMNCDGKNDGMDIEPFVIAILTP